MPCSYGFRPPRSAHEALREIPHVLWRMRKLWVCHLDLRARFHPIPPRLGAVRRHVRDKCVLRLVRRWLKAGILDEDVATFALPRPQPDNIEDALFCYTLEIVMIRGY